jgi:hypothetical protein
VKFLSLGGIGRGMPVRGAITRFRPVLPSRVFDRDLTRKRLLGLMFHYVDQAGLPLVDFEDLRAVVS